MIRLVLVSVIVSAVLFCGCGSSRHQTAGGGVDPLQGRNTNENGMGQSTDDGTRVVPAVTMDIDDDGGTPSGLEPVFFRYNSYDLQDDQKGVLERNAGLLLQNEKAVLIQGHCDERGTEEYNLALGERRARAVKDYLVRLGVPEDRLTTVSYGESMPFQNGHNESAWSQNRRAHFVTPTQAQRK